MTKLKTLTPMLCLLLAGCAATPEPEPAPAPEPVSYVALGDSYAALGSPETAEETACLNGPHNYPARILAHPEIVGTDVSCSGAQTGDVLDNQITALSEETELVTLSVGGNDIGFGALVSCFYDVMQQPARPSCEGQLAASVSGQLDRLPELLDGTHRVIVERAPQARVVVTGYMPLVTENDACLPVPPSDITWAAGLIDELNATVADAAERADASFVLPGNADAHTGCAAPDQRWVDFFGTETQAHPMHPTPLGQEVMAEAVLASVPRP